MSEPCFECHAPPHERPCRCDLKEEIARIKLEKEYAEDSLDAAKEEIARLTAERDALVERVDWAREGAYRAHEERAAIAAAAFEAAALTSEGIAKAAAAQAGRHHLQSRSHDDWMEREYGATMAYKAIRALTTADAKAALDRMLETAKAAVKVKPLEFVGTVAKTKFGFYRVWPCEDGFWRVGFDSRLLLISNPITTENAAKEAAQADYERRILSALK